MPVPFLMMHVVLLSVVLFVASAEAQTPRRVALVIGNAAYAHAGALRNPVNDATDVAEKLGRLGFEVSLAHDKDGRAMTGLIRDFRARLAGADVGLLFYAGHAIQVGGTNYLLPVDADLQDELDIERQTIRLQAIVEEMERSARTNIVFLDACRDNPMASRLKSVLAPRGRSAMLGRGLAAVAGSGSDTLVMFSAAPGEIAEDGEGRNSPFTAALLKHMTTPEEISLMLKDVIADVRAATRGKQRPQQVAAMERRFYLVPSLPRLATPPFKPATPVSPSVAKEAAIAQGLLAKGMALIAAGDIAGARVVLSHGPLAEHPDALFALAETYDPNMIAARGIIGLKAETDRARDLYAKALGAGAIRARARLEALDFPITAPPPSSALPAPKKKPAVPQAFPGVAPTGLGYVAVLSSKRSQVDAISVLADLKQRYGEVLNALTLTVVAADLGDKGTWYRVVAGPPASRELAGDVCRQLDAAGLKGCFTSRY